MCEQDQFEKDRQDYEARGWSPAGSSAFCWAQAWR